MISPSLLRLSAQTLSHRSVASVSGARSLGTTASPFILCHKASSPSRQTKPINVMADIEAAFASYKPLPAQPPARIPPYVATPTIPSVPLSHRLTGTGSTRSMPRPLLLSRSSAAVAGAFYSTSTSSSSTRSIHTHSARVERCESCGCESGSRMVNDRAAPHFDEDIWISWPPRSDEMVNGQPHQTS